MRFAYIDSNGNEVPIPSVDALALRIELGAITDQTELYDAQADQWGPAHTHEIFHSLARSVGGDDGFVAPPPAAPIARPAPPPKAPEPPVHASPPPEPTAGEPVAPPADPPTQTSGADLGLTLAEPIADEPVGFSMEGLGPSLDEELVDDPMSFGEVSLEPVHEVDVDVSGGAFDFGDMDGGLQLDEVFNDAGAPLDLTGGFDAGGPHGRRDGLNVDPPMEFVGGRMDAGDSGLDLETPMSEFSPESPPNWMAGGQGGGDDGDAMDFSSVVAGAGKADEEVPLRERRTPRNKPSPPKHRRQRNLAGPLLALLAVGAIGGGGYLAWPVLQARLLEPAEPDVPAVFIPELPSELAAQMQSVGDGAMRAAFSEVRGRWSASASIQSPPREWLSGAYLANASAYDSAETFWRDMADLVTSLRGIDVTAFDAAYAAELQRQGIQAADGDLMRAHADSLYVVATPARVAAYDRLDALVGGALRLHQFLVANEASIEHTPASTLSSDPVLEVQPATDAIRAAMEELLDAVTRGLGGLNYREAVTAQGLVDSVLDQVQATGLR